MNESVRLGDNELNALVDLQRRFAWLHALLDRPNVVRFVGFSRRTLRDLHMVSELVIVEKPADFLAQSDRSSLT